MNGVKGNLELHDKDVQHCFVYIIPAYIIFDTAYKKMSVTPWYSPQHIKLHTAKIAISSEPSLRFFQIVHFF